MSNQPVIGHGRGVGLFERITADPTPGSEIFEIAKTITENYAGGHRAATAFAQAEMRRILERIKETAMMPPSRIYCERIVSICNQYLQPNQETEHASHKPTN